jgi:hypothetical protein
LKKTYLALVAFVASLFAMHPALAALPAGAEAAVTGYQTDTLQMFGLVIAAGIAIWAIRKLGQKFGWL